MGCMDHVHLCSGSSSAVAPLEVAHFLLLDFLGAVGVDLLGGLLGAAGADFSVAEPSPVISAMIYSRLLFSVAVRVTLVAAASSSINVFFIFL